MINIVAIGFVAAALLLRRVFIRAIDGGVPLKQQRLFWPTFVGTWALGVALALWLFGHLWAAGYPAVALAWGLFVAASVARARRVGQETRPAAPADDDD